jgi:hypothetical protein
MPTLFNFFGMRYYFWSREHEPIHVHVEKAGHEAKFDLTPVSVELSANKGFKPHELALAEETIQENRTIIIQRWNEFFGNKNIKEEKETGK